MVDADQFSRSLLDFAIQSLEDALRTDDQEFLAEAECALKVLRRHLDRSISTSDGERSAAIALLDLEFPKMVANKSSEERKAVLVDALNGLRTVEKCYFSS